MLTNFIKSEARSVEMPMERMPLPPGDTHRQAGRAGLRPFTRKTESSRSATPMRSSAVSMFLYFLHLESEPGGCNRVLLEASSLCPRDLKVAGLVRFSSGAPFRFLGQEKSRIEAARKCACSCGKMSLVAASIAISSKHCSPAVSSCSCQSWASVPLAGAACMFVSP